ncbi:MAG: glycosyltransferase [Bacteroidetes bacterium]|nr:MAG: glycosyltransferase [Bacteroidota bacterium]
MIYLAIIVLWFALIRFLVVLYNIVGRQWLRNGEPENFPLVSVLIPARNEEKNIASILDDLSQHDYPNLEIIVYDDLSGDATYETALSKTQKDPRIQVLKGGNLPEGWLGKNHGCHRLSLHARGEYMLYLDADVQIKKGLIKNALAHVKKHQLDLFSIFPTQKMHSLGERLTVPLMNWILVSLLPLVLTRKSSWSSFSAANGQFMFFRAEVYHREQFHKTLKEQKVEDIAIFRLMKKKEYKVHTVLGNGQISCRMYSSWNESVMGFSRSVFDFFGGSKMLAFLFGIITTLGFIPVLLALPLIFTFFYFLLIVLMRAMIAAASRQNVILNLLLAPLQQLSFMFVMVKAAVLQFAKTTQWKGRLIDK